MFKLQKVLPEFATYPELPMNDSQTLTAKSLFDTTRLSNLELFFIKNRSVFCFYF